MDIANFIEQFEDDLESESNFVNENISPPETSLNVPICSTTENNVKMRELNNEVFFFRIFIKKFIFIEGN